MIYVIGSLRNPRVVDVANQLEAAGFDVFAEWYAAGERADDCWKAYEQARGRTFVQALKGPAARHVFEFDRRYLKGAEAVVLVAPAGKSGHLELGWALGRGIPGFYLLDPAVDRWDVMLQFCWGITAEMGELIRWLRDTQKARAEQEASAQARLKTLES